MTAKEQELRMNDGDMLFWDHDGKEYCLLVHRDNDPMNPRTEYGNVSTMFCFHPRYELGDRDTGCRTPDEFWATLTRNSVPEEDILASIRKEREENGLSDRELLDWFYDEVENEGHISLAMRACEKHAAWLPLWIYDHSGITVSCGERTYPYNDRFDSGLVGWVATTKDTALKCLSAKENDPPMDTEAGWKRAAVIRMKQEVEAYDRYLAGDAWWYELYESRTKTEEDGIRRAASVSDSDEWEEIESCSGFLGDDVLGNGLVENVGYGLMEAIRDGTCETGRDETYTVVCHRFARHGRVHANDK